MIKGIYIAGRSLDSKFKNIEVIGNNLANVNSTGFKKALNFTELVNKANRPEIIQDTDFSQGNLTPTSNPLDLGINGNAFFAVQTSGGIEFTKNGKFSISDDGFLVNGKNEKVLGKSGPINFKSYQLDKDQSVSISKNGDIKIGDNYVDSLMIIKPDNLKNLVRQDGTDFISADGSLQIAGENEFEIQQGYLEESNVNPIEEMTSMIKVHNDYNSAAKMITFLDQSLQEANDIGKV